MTDPAYAWAVFHPSGKLIPNTVYDSRRGALVNFLITNGYQVFAGTSDAHIEFMWEGAKDNSKFRMEPFTVREVEIREKV